MTIKIANSPVSWGVDYADDPNNPDWKKVFTEISKSGYQYSESGPYGYLPSDFQIIKDHMNSINLKIIGGFIFDNLHQPSKHHQIKDKIINSCRLLKKLNSSYFVIIDHISKERMDTSGDQKNSVSLEKNDFKAMSSFIKEISNICYEEYGLLPVYHPHAGTYIEYESEIDDILNEVNSDYLGLCLDTAHLYYSAVDPYLAIEKYDSKIKYMHLKDIDQNVLNNVYKNKIDFDTAVKMNVFCPLGNGVIDFPKILKNLNNINYSGYATIEQDIDPNEGLNPQEYAKNSLSFLTKSIV